MKKNDMCIENVQHVIAACWVLHNMCEIHMDSFEDDWMEESDSGLRQPDVSHAARDTIINDRPVDIRDALVRHLAI